MNSTKKTVLVVDDDENNREILEIYLQDEGYNVLLGKDGKEGWELLQQYEDQICVILLDRTMPNMGGMEFMARLKADEALAWKPVIMQTAISEKTHIAEGIKAGVYYYLTKPYSSEVMLSIVRAAISDFEQHAKLREELKQHKANQALLKEIVFEIQTLADVSYLTGFLAGYYPDAERVILGISELLINAIEHGNLGISYKEKSQLLQQGKWHQEVKRLLALPENRDKRVRVHMQCGNDAVLLTIKDDGEGFDWQKYVEIDPMRKAETHGRGIALSNLASFDSVEYRGKGNEVVCTVAIQPPVSRDLSEERREAG